MVEAQLTNYTYNIANQLISDGAQSFSYDANGRLISAGDRSYSYALNDRLIALSQPGLSATFAYNGDGVRLAQTTNGNQTRYLVDTQRRYSEVVGAITPESETWYLLGLDVLGQQQGSDWSYYAYDGLGSVRLALDSSGGPRAGMRYEPYGLPAASWGTPPALGFTGEWTDSSGLLYLRARYLDPSSATFLSRDPFEGLPTRALSRNGYAWVEGNPVSRSDPSGMCWANPSASPDQQAQCYDAWFSYMGQIEAFYPSLPADLHKAIGQAAPYWSALDYVDFIRLWNDPNVSYDQALALTMMTQGVSLAMLDSPALGPFDIPGWIWCAAGLAVLARSHILQILPQRPYYDFSQSVLEYHLSGFNKKVGTLAEHLAKILGRDVAGYPPSGPNPNRYPDGGWCTTIKRIISQIDGKYKKSSKGNLNIDLQIAGFAGVKWAEIISAVREVVDLGLCDDHWGNFGGGSLAGG